MAKVKFKRISNSNDINNIPIEDGSFIVTGDGKTYVDYNTNRIPTSGTPDTTMSDSSKNTVENKVIKDYVDSEITRNINANNPVVLFTSSSGEQSTINLSDNKSNYEYVEILARSNGGNTFSVKVMTSSNSFEISAIDDNGVPTQGILWLKWGRYNFNNTTIVPTYQGWSEILSSPDTHFINSNFTLFKIYKVLGYK